MKIAVLIDNWFPATGGGPIHVWEIYTRIAKKYNCQVEVVTSRLRTSRIETQNSKLKTTIRNLKIIRLGPSFYYENPLGRIIYLILATRRLLFGDYDLISAHVPLQTAIPAKVVNFFRGIPVVLTIHGVYVDVWEKMKPGVYGKFLALLEKQILFSWRYDYQISVSSDFLKYKNVNQKIALIGNGVDFESFAKVSAKKAKLFKILFAGRLHPQKGLFYLIDAAKIVFKNHPEVFFVLVGDGPIREELEKYTQKIGMSDHLIFKGKLTSRELISEYQSSHLFVLSSLQEGFPLTILEAWAAKLPVIATSVGENPKIIKNGIDGILVPPADSSTLAKAIISVIENPNREKMGVAGFSQTKKFSWDRIAQKTHQIFREVLN